MHYGSQLGMPPEMAPNLHGVRTQVEHCAHALNDGLEPRIIRELEGEVEQMPAWDRSDTEPAGCLVDGNGAAICAVTHRFHTRRRFGGEQRGRE
jgi:hypothetical protein